MLKPNANTVWQRREAMSSQTTQAHSALKPSLVYRYRHTTDCQLPRSVHSSGQFKLLLHYCSITAGVQYTSVPQHNRVRVPILFCTRNRKITASVCCRQRHIPALHLTKCCTLLCRCCCGTSLTVKHRDYPLSPLSQQQQQTKQKSHCGPSEFRSKTPDSTTLKQKVMQCCSPNHAVVHLCEFRSQTQNSTILKQNCSFVAIVKSRALIV